MRRRWECVSYPTQKFFFCPVIHFLSPPPFSSVPKSIDNDLLLVDACFGFSTAVSEAQRSITSASVEARSQRHGVGLVKLMGRTSGALSVAATVASGEVDLCLIPEVLFVFFFFFFLLHCVSRRFDARLICLFHPTQVPFDKAAVCDHILRLIADQGHAVVVVAEGAGQDIIRAEMLADGADIVRCAGGFLVL